MPLTIFQHGVSGPESAVFLLVVSKISFEMKTIIFFWRAKVLRDSYLYSNVVPLMVLRDVSAASQEVSIMHRV